MSEEDKVTCKYEYNRGIKDGVKQGKLEVLEFLRAREIINYSKPDDVYFHVSHGGAITYISKGLD